MHYTSTSVKLRIYLHNRHLHIVIGLLFRLTALFSNNTPADACIQRGLKSQSQGLTSLVTVNGHLAPRAHVIDNYSHMILLGNYKYVLWNVDTCRVCFQALYIYKLSAP